jgi:hypothetical protein
MRAIRSLGAATVLALTLTGLLTAQQATPASAPKDATGQCTDGSYTTAKTQAKGCLKHGGVKTWFGSAAAAPAPAAGEATAPKAHEAASAKSTASGARPKDATGQCTDGSYTTAKTQARGCLKHGGVQTWYGSNASATSGTAAAAPAAAATPAAPAPQAPAPTPTVAPASARSRAAAPAAAPAQAPANPSDVWVNTSTKAYHCPGTKYYGTTKHGKYMSEADAKAAGFHPAYGKACGA